MEAVEMHEYEVDSEMTESSGSSDDEVQEEWMPEPHNLILSPSSVANIMMKSITKSDYMISDDAKKLMYDCAVRFVEVVFEEAKEVHREQGDDIFTGDHIVEALGNIGLCDHYGYFSAFIQHYRWSEDNHRHMVNAIAQIDQQPQLIGTAQLMDQQGNNSGNQDPHFVHPGIHMQPQLIGPIGTVLMEQQGNNPGHRNPHLVHQGIHMHPQLIGTALMEQQGNNPGHPDPHLAYRGIHMQLPQQVPQHFHIPPFEMHRAHVPVVDLGIPVISCTYTHTSQVVVAINNPSRFQLPEQALPAPPQMLLANAIGAGAHHFEQPEEEQVPDPIMNEGDDDGDNTSVISEV